MLMMIINALNGVCSEIYFLQTIIQKESEKLRRILQEHLILKTYNFLSKLEILLKLKERVVSTLSLLVIKPVKYVQSMSKKYIQKTCWFITDTRRMQKALCSYQRSSCIYAWSYITPRKNFFFRYSLLTLSTVKVLKIHFNDYFKINGKHMVRCLK